MSKFTLVNFKRIRNRVFVLMGVFLLVCGIVYSLFPTVRSYLHPHLFTQPPVFLTLTSTFRVADKPYSVSFGWSQDNYIGLDEGRGFFRAWKSSDRTVVRILDKDYAVIIWLPSTTDYALEKFSPNVLLINRSDLSSLRKYDHLTAGENRDGFFQLSELKTERSNRPSNYQPMTKDEKALKEEIENRKYGYLYGMSFSKAQWSQSKELTAALSDLDGDALFGTQNQPGVWDAYGKFNFLMKKDLEPKCFGFEMKNGVWMPLPYAGVHNYREGLADQKDAILVLYRTLHFDQHQNELLFDSTNQELVVIYRYPLEHLDVQD